MVPYDSDQGWQAIQEWVKEMDVGAAGAALLVLLEKNHKFSQKQAVQAVATMMLGTHDPTAHRARLVGVWSQVEQRGVIGFGESSRKATEYTFGGNFTYSYYYGSTSAYSSPPSWPGGPPAVMRSPSFVEVKDSGVYLVAVRSERSEVCLCSEKDGTARLIKFSFNSDRSVFLKGFGNFTK